MRDAASPRSAKPATCLEKNRPPSLQTRIACYIVYAIAPADRTLEHLARNAPYDQFSTSFVPRSERIVAHACDQKGHARPGRCASPKNRDSALCSRVVVLGRSAQPPQPQPTRSTSPRSAPLHHNLARTRVRLERRPKKASTFVESPLSLDAYFVASPCLPFRLFRYADPESRSLRRFSWRREIARIAPRQSMSRRCAEGEVDLDPRHLSYPFDQRFSPFCCNRPAGVLPRYLSWPPAVDRSSHLVPNEPHQ